MRPGLLRRIRSRVAARLYPPDYFDDIMAMHRANDSRGAYETLQRRIKRQPYLAKCGDIYVFWAHLELLVGHDSREVLELVDEAEKRGCLAMDFCYATRAKALYDSGEKALGLELLEKAIDMDPCIGYVTDLGRMLTYSKDQRAVSVWEDVLKKEPDYCAAHIYLGMMAFYRGDEDTARAKARMGDAMQLWMPDSTALAWLYEQLGEYGNAIKVYRQARKEDIVEKAQFDAAIAHCYISLGDARAARKYARRALRRDPECEDAKEVWARYEDTFG